MLEKINLFQMATSMASHAGTRQAVIAQNIANADTPGYKARDVTPFAELVRASGEGFSSRATRSNHLYGTSGPAEPEVLEKPGGVSNPNGNQVALEDEMLKAVEVKRQHDRALAIYRSGLTILRSSLGRG
jgi:flagellar basal-body rod protein FlgB